MAELTKQITESFSTAPPIKVSVKSKLLDEPMVIKDEGQFVSTCKLLKIVRGEIKEGVTLLVESSSQSRQSSSQHQARQEDSKTREVAGSASRESRVSSKREETKVKEGSPLSDQTVVNGQSWAELKGFYMGMRNSYRNSMNFVSNIVISLTLFYRKLSPLAISPQSSCWSTLSQGKVTTSHSNYLNNPSLRKR